MMDIPRIRARMEASRAFTVDHEGVVIHAVTPSELDVSAAGTKGFDNSSDGIHYLAVRLTRGLDNASIDGDPIDTYSAALGALWYQDNMAAAVKVFSEAMDRFNAQKDARAAEKKI